jgi:CubicO group peptidase (beta-lactamase class C family)
MDRSAVIRRHVLTATAALPFLGTASASAASQQVPSATGLEQAARYSAQRRGVSMVVMAQGRMVFEDYPQEGGAQRAWETASGTKSFSGILAAAAAAEGLLTLDEPCASTLVEWAHDPRAAIRLHDLLSLTSGLPAGPIGRPPSYGQAIEAQPVAPVGSVFQYGPTPFQIFGEILRRKLAQRGMHPDPVRYLQQRVLEPAGVRIGAWRAGPDGHPLMPQGAALTARDWTKFGQFVLEGGPGLAPGTLAANFEGSSANPGYGLSWWLLRPGLVPPGPQAGLSETWSPALNDESVVMAAGAGHQRLYLLRRRAWVVVRQATGILEALRGGGSPWSDQAFLSALLQ